MHRILVVDDDAIMRDMIRSYLEAEGHDVIEASNGRDALAKHRLSPADIAIVDIFMPTKDGIETILELRRMTPCPRILAISGGGEIGGLEYLSYAKVLGADGALAKPFGREDLLRAIASLSFGDKPAPPL